MVYDISLYSLYNEDYVFDKYLDPQPYLGCELSDIFNDDENCSTRKSQQNDAKDTSLESVDFENLKNDFSCNRLTNIDYTDFKNNNNVKQMKLGKDDILINDDETGLIDATKGTASNLYLESLSYSYDKFFQALAQGDLKKQWEVSKSIVDTVMRVTENEVRFLQPSGDNNNFSELPKSKFIEITHSILKNHYAPLLSNFDTPVKEKDFRSTNNSNSDTRNSVKNIAFDFSSNRDSMIAEITALTEKNKITEKVKNKRKKKRKLKFKATWHKEPIYQVDITDQDVLLGRGGHAIQHPGNKFFRKLASDFREEYNRASKREKTKIAEKIVSLVQSKGRFLKQDETKKRCWYRITGQEIRKKASQALRESK